MAAALLHIDASLDRKGSNSRRLSKRFVRLWTARNPNAAVLRRDLARTPAPPLTETFVRAVKTPPEQRSGPQRRAWRASQRLAEEFMRADRYVIGMPMHILTAPSPFKAYVEQIFHEDRVFRVDENGVAGLLGGRKFLFFLSKGADYRPGAPLAPFDMLEPYLVKLLTFCGAAERDIAFVSLNNALSYEGPDPADEDRAAREMERLAETW